MNMWEFMNASPWLTFFLALIVVAGAFNLIAFIYNRTLRYMNIRKHGYPPAHCDADGDFRNSDKDY